MLIKKELFSDMERDILIKRLQEILVPLIRAYSNYGTFGDHESCHGNDISWFEMFCRSSYGIVAYTRASNDFSFLNKFSETLLSIIKDNRYTEFKNYDQKAVELAPVALLLLMYKENTWDTYTMEQKQTITSYFENINKIQLCSNNWIFFRIIICSALQQLTGRDYSLHIDQGWKLVDQCYQGEGWYRDGINGTEDYYNAFGFHFYSLLYNYLFDDEERNKIIRKRAILFARQYYFFFDEEGRSIPFGRSLIYRYAVVSFWSMMLVNRLLNDKESKHASKLISNHLEWWSHQQVYDINGYQCLGYAYPNNYMLEAYNSSGSVYWSLKAFLVLLAGEQMEIWGHDDSCNQIIDYGSHRLANGNIIISTTPCGNIAYVNSFNGSGQRQDPAKYMHFAYHSATGFNIDRSLSNSVSLSDDSSLFFDINGVKIVRKSNIIYKNRSYYIQDFFWRAGDYIKVYSSVIPLGNYYTRIHVIESRVDCTCYETGFPISSNDSRTILKTDTLCGVVNPFYNSAIYKLVGNGQPLFFRNERSSNIYYNETVLPAISYKIKKGRQIIADLTGLNYSSVSEDAIVDVVKSTFVINGDRIEIKNGNQDYYIGSRFRRSLEINAWIKEHKNLMLSIIHKVSGPLKRVVCGIIKK